MGESERIHDHRKRKRRRRPERPPISGFLQPSDHLRSAKCSISSDLFEEFFPHQVKSSPEEATPEEQPVFVAVTPWVPARFNHVEDHAWTILPVTPRKAQETELSKQVISTIRVPASAPALQTLARRLQRNPFGKHGNREKQGYEIRVTAVEPLPLDTVYVTVDGDALEKHEEVQKRFGGGFPGQQINGYHGKGRKSAKPSATTPANPTSHGDDELTSAIREALSSAIVARQGDLLPLPLPAHPITHIPFPPAQITLCEPVSQGLPSAATKVVVNRTHTFTVIKSPPAQPSFPVLSSSKSLTDFDITDGDGTSNEAFHSAAEDGQLSDGEDQAPASDSDDPLEDSEAASDDSGDEIITMSTPALPVRASGTLSARTATTPRPYNPRANGVSTPGSIFSNMTSTTARQSEAARSKLFKAQTLTQKVPWEMLQPPPGFDDDEDCRIFVDIKVLVRLGCFSGDWVTIEPGQLPDARRQLQSLGASSHAGNSRPAKIYGLPDLQPTSMVRSAGGMPFSRRSSTLTSAGLAFHGLNVWLPPILSANLGQAEFIRISPIMAPSLGRPSSRQKSGRRKMDCSATAPIANEMTLLRVSTPLSTERALQNGLFMALKQHFERARRIVKQGDLIAIPFDMRASRLLSSNQVPEGEDELEEILSHMANENDGAENASAIAWFKIGSVNGPEPLEASELNSDVWNGAVSIEPRTTRMRQAGTEQCKIPANLEVTRPSYYDRRSPSGNAAKSLTIPLDKPYIPAIRRRLRELVAAAASPRAIHLGLKPVIILLHSTQRNIGKSTMATQAASDVGLHTFLIDAYDLLAEGTGGGDVKTEAFLKARVDRGLSCGAQFTSILLRHVDALNAERMTTAIKDIVADVRLLIATTTELDNVSEGVRSLFTHELEVSAPDEDERQGLLRNIINERGLQIANDVDVAAIAVKTAALVAGNLVDIVERAMTARLERLENLVQSSKHPTGAHETDLTTRDVLLAGGDPIRCITKADFDLAVEAARKNFADAIGAPKIPNVSWDDVGGLENVKDAVMETIQLPLERPELFAKGMKKRSGILFYGPPGTGKTLLAKAIATEFSLNFFSIKGPELLNMYIGESEANVRRVFQRARDARPCVVFFDELDSVAPKRGNQGDSGGVMDRIVSQLLAELDGMSDGEEGSGGVFVIGATNRPDLLDQALLRPGRFDKMLYLGVSDTHEKQTTILEALTRKFTTASELSLRRVAEELPFTYTGADLYALCSDAMLKAITRQASAVDAKIRDLPGGPVTTAYFFDHLATEQDIAVTVTEDDFAGAQKELVSSVSAKELEHYQRVRRDFEGPPRSQSVTGTSAPASNQPNGYLIPPGKKPKAPQRSSTMVHRPSEDNKGKGKGKATTWDSDEDDDDEAYVTSNDYATPERRKSSVMNGSGANAFRDVGEDDDGELYG